MNTIIHWLFAKIDNFRTWCSIHHTNVATNFWNCFDAISRNLISFAVIGIILNIVAIHYPALPYRFPAIYGWFDGWLQLGEFTLKVALDFIYSLFTGNFYEFWSEYTVAFQELLNQFINWLSTLHF